MIKNIKLCLMDKVDHLFKTPTLVSTSKLSYYLKLFPPSTDMINTTKHDTRTSEVSDIDVPIEKVCAVGKALSIIYTCK